MELVANHLEAEAVDRLQKPEECDEFGRSAFNRYYYATFLTVREMMRNFDPSWSGGHGSLPEELTGSTKRVFARAKTRAYKIGDKQFEGRCKFAIHHLHELADHMTRIYGIRTIADYQPEELITIVAGKITLASVEISEAKHWAKKAQGHAGQIISVWNEIHGS